MLNWAVGREYLDRTPFRRGTETLIRKLHEDNQRRRRISEDEEATLLAVATPFLRSMIIAALDTGMRQGEMLALRFGDIDWKRQLIVLRGVTTKSRRTRTVPIATARLRAVLDGFGSSRTASRSRTKRSCSATRPASRRPFRTAWVTAVLKAHGVKPEWKVVQLDGAHAGLQAAFRQINLHWHDLRHEYASRLVERGVPLAQVARSARSRVDHHDRALRQPEAREPAARCCQARKRQNVRRAAARERCADKLSSFCQEFG